MLCSRAIAMLAALWLVWVPASHATTLHVPREFGTPQAAVDAAKPGDEIVLAPGEYDVPTTVPERKRGITIRGESGGEVTCRLGIEVNAANVTISDMTLERGEYGIWIRPGASCTVRNVSCSDQDICVHIEGGTADLEGVRCAFGRTAGIVATGEGADLTVNGGLVVLTAGTNGILIEEGATARLTDVAVRYGKTNGISVQTGATVTLTDCVVEHHPETGLLVESASGTARNCRFGYSKPGVTCRGRHAELVIEGGRIANCHYGCVHKNGAAGSLVGAEIADNYVGVRVVGSSILVADNWIHDNAYNGVRLSGYHLPFDRWSEEDIHQFCASVEGNLVASPTIIRNRFSGNRSSIFCIDAKPTNALTLDVDNEFDSTNHHRASIGWRGAVRVMKDGVPVAGAEVSLRAANGSSRHMCLTDSAGYAPGSEDLKSGRWSWIYQHVVSGDGTRVELNPWTITATAGQGALRCTSTCSWDGRPKSSGFDVEGLYHVAYVELNAKPTANAGPDRTVAAAAFEGAEVTLDASGSSDEDDEDLTYSWMEGDTVIAGPTTEPKVTVLLTPGVYTLTLLVDDGQDDPAEDQCTITVTGTR